MNRSIRKVALALGVVFAAVLVNLNIVQIARSGDLSADARNRRRAIAEEGVRRGDILASDGTVLAESVPSGDPRFKWARRYPSGALFGHVTGYFTSPFFCDSTGLERTQSDFLTGLEPATRQDFVDELLGRQREGNTLKLTLDPALQKLARERLGKDRGGAVVIDSETGAILAMYGSPSFDPNRIAEANGPECVAAKQALEENPNKVLLSRAFQVRYAPGSTFKIVTAAAGLEAGMKGTSTFSNPRALKLPDTDKTLGNFGGGACPGGARISMSDAFRVSCNTTFAQVALRAGGEKFIGMAEKFGLQSDPEMDLNVLPSCVTAPFSGRACDDASLSGSFLAQSGIGQKDVRVTPLQMAIVAATVGNGGFVPKPHVVSQVIDTTGKVLHTTEPERSKRIYTAATAKAMRSFMTAVVCRGTGAGIRFRNACSGSVGGKTGTAEAGVKGVAPDVWFVGWGPGVAVAVVIEKGGSIGSEATGGRVAGPVAKALLEAALARKAAKS